MSTPVFPPDTHRAAELGWALAALDRGARAVAVVGLAGAGKTWFLARLEDELAARGSEDVLCCDAPVELSRLTARCVFTSRHRPGPDFPDCALVELAPLAASAATQLLATLVADRAPHQAPASDETMVPLTVIAEAAGGLPGALVLAAEAARLMDLPTLARRAQAEPEALFAPIIAELATELADLSDAELAALQRLGVFGRGVGSAMAEALVSDHGADVASARRPRLDGPLGLLGDLRDRHLLLQRGDRLAVPTLVRAALRALGEPPLHDVARRAAALAAKTTQEALRHGRSEPLGWIGTERDNLLMALTALVDAEADEAWPLVHALLVELWRGTALPVRAHRQILLGLLDRLLTIAERSGLREAAVEPVFQAARTAFDQRDQALLIRVANLLRAHAPGSFHAAWATAAEALVSSSPSLRATTSALLEVAEQTSDRHTLGVAHLFASGALTADPQEAVEHAGLADAHFEACGYAWGRASALANLAYFAMARGDIEATRRHARLAIDMAEGGGDRRSLATSLGNLGLLECDQGELEAARDLLTRSLALHEAMNRPDFMAACHNGLARIAVEAATRELSPVAARDLDRAEASLREIERHLGADLGVQRIESALVRAEMALLRGHPEGARAVLDAALSLPELAAMPLDALVLAARRAVIAPETAALHRAAADDLASRAPDSSKRSAGQVYRALWCSEPEWPALAAELGRIARVPLAKVPPLGLAPAWNNSALVRAALRTTWPRLSEARRQDVEAAARDPERAHLVAALSTGRFRMPRGDFKDVSRRPLLVHLLTLLVTGCERGLALDEAALGEALWPGERMLEGARTNRIQNAISLLRKAGLEDHLERGGDGYRISPALPLITVTGARDAMG